MTLEIAQGITKSVKIDFDLWQMFQDTGEKSFSGFINELMDEALGNKNFVRKKYTKQMQDAAEKLRLIGGNVEFNIDFPAKQEQGAQNAQNPV